MISTYIIVYCKGFKGDILNDTSIVVTEAILQYSAAFFIEIKLFIIVSFIKV